ISAFRCFEVALSRVQVAKSEMRREILRVRRGRAREKVFRQFVVTSVPCKIAEGRERLTILLIERKNASEGLTSGIFLPELPLERAVVHQRVDVRWSQRQSFFQIAICRVKIAGRGFDSGAKAQPLRALSWRRMHLLNDRRRGCERLLRLITVFLAKSHFV